MKFELGDNKLVLDNEYLLIHFFHYVLKFNFRDGIFFDESSIYDLSDSVLSESQIARLKQEYYNSVPSNFDYYQGMRFYFNLKYAEVKQQYNKNCLMTYGFSLYDVGDIHLLREIIQQLKATFPARNWKQECVFVFKQQDVESQSDRREEVGFAPASSNVVPIGVVRKPSKEIILEGFNPLKIAESEDISIIEAIQIVDKNREEKFKDAKFYPP